MRFRLFLVIFASLLLTWEPATQAQPPGPAGTCPALVEQALSEVSSNCDDLERNNACYGYRQVDSTFTNDVPDRFFSRPSDRSTLTVIGSIRTAPLNLAEEEWGVAIVKALANIPGTLPGQAVTFVLLGDAEIENGVEREDAFSPGEAIEVEATSNTVMRSGPRTNTNMITGIPAGATVQVDAINPDADWVRATYDERFGWVSRAMVAEDPQIDDLPVLDSETYTPMQAFYLRTGIGRSECEEAPDTLVVQGPQELLVDINANGADIRLGSTIVLEVFDSSEIMRLTVIDGTAYLYPDTEDEIEVEAGFYATICLTENPDNLGVDDIENDFAIGEDCRWSTPVEATRDDLVPFLTLEGIPEDVLEYEIDVVLPPEDIVECRINDEWLGTYIVQPEDTLSSIAPRYELTVMELAQGNCIENPDVIVTDSELVVPVVEVAVVPDDPVDDDPVSDPPVVVPPPTGVDLGVTIAASATVLNPLDPVTLTVSISNAGPENARGVQVGVNIPPGIAISNVNAPAGTSYNGGVWTIGDLNSGSTPALTLNGQVNANTDGTTQTVTAQVNAVEQQDNNPGNDTAGVPITVGSIIDASVTIVETVGGTYDESKQVTFNITAANNSPTPVTGATVQLTIDNLQQNSWVPTTGTYDPVTALWTIGDLAAGATGTLTLEATIIPGSAGATATTSAAITINETDTNTANNTAAAVLNVIFGTIAVNTDSVVVNPTDGICSLVEAVTSAEINSASGTVPGECGTGSAADIIDLSTAGGPINFVGANLFGLNALPPITTAITIDGGDTLIQRDMITAPPLFRFFDVQPSGNLTLNNIALSGGDAGPMDNGGAILVNQGTLTLSNATIINSVASNGGAIAVELGNANIVNTTFDGNSAENGGAIFVLGSATVGSTVTFNGGLVQNNTANMAGGAFFVSGDAQLTSNGVTFLNNIAQVGQGQITDGGDTAIPVIPVINFSNGNQINAPAPSPQCDAMEITINDDGTNGGNASDGTCYP
jgi:predicted outer membrane repeat protein